MKSRDEYLASLKSQLDVWNAQIEAWEAKAAAAKAEMNVDYQRQLGDLRAGRDQMQARMKRAQEASADAWADMVAGTDTAWKALADAFNSASARFGRK